jgi:hypothetical protein
MADMDSDARGAEEPLDPAAERLRRKLTWLLAGSLGVMMLGLIAVFAAIVYRVGGEPAAPAESQGDPASSVIALPEGARVVFAGLDENRLLVRVELPDGATRLIVLDPRTGAVQSQVELRPGG